MTELAAAELVVVQGYCRGEITGKALRVPDPDPDAEPGDTILGKVVSEPVATAAQLREPMLTALAAHTHIKTQRRETTPIDASGYWAIPAVATNDPDVTIYAGRKITLPDGTVRIIQIPFNAPTVAASADMVAQVNTGLGGAALTVGASVRAIWFSDAADFTTPAPTGPPAIYTAAQVDSIVAALGSPTWVSIQGKPTFADIATSGSASHLTTGTVPNARISSDIARQTAVDGKVDKTLVDAKGDMLVGSGDDTVVRVPVGSDGRVWTADSSVTAGASWQTPTSSGGGGGGGTPDLPEAARLPYTAAVSPPADLLSKTTRFVTTTGAVTQTLPLAQTGRVLAVGWDSGAAAFTLSGAARTDTATVTGGSANIADTAITAADQGRLVTGTGIPPGSYVGTVTPNSSFVLSSSPVTTTSVNATASSTAVTISDVIGSGTATTRLLETPGELLSLHATSNGQWRVYSGFRPSQGLTPVGPKTGAYTAAPGELVKVDTTSGAVTITAPATGVGRAFAVKNLTGTNLVTVARAGSDTLGSAGATTIPVRFDDQVTYFGYDPTAPTAWLITHNHLPPTALDNRFERMLARGSRTTAGTASSGATAVRVLGLDAVPVVAGHVYRISTIGGVISSSAANSYAQATLVYTTDGSVPTVSSAAMAALTIPTPLAGGGYTAPSMSALYYPTSDGTIRPMVTANGYSGNNVTLSGSAAAPLQLIVEDNGVAPTATGTNY